jgi:hypothetical protein
MRSCFACERIHRLCVRYLTDSVAEDMFLQGAAELCRSCRVSPRPTKPGISAGFSACLRYISALLEPGRHSLYLPLSELSTAL